MKNRLQFNRIPTIFSGETRIQGGEEVWFSGREQAKEALDNYIKRGSFIPLIGEPIAVRYTDDKGDRQTILAIGKSTGTSLDMVNQREYHIIDSAELQEGVNSANEKADNALDLASAATQSVNNYFQILKNMIEAEGIDLDDGSYFDDDDPTKDPSTCGKYKPLENSNYLDDAKNLREADKLLDEAIGGVSDDLDGLSAATASLSGTTQEYFNNIIEAAGLTTGEAGKYPGHDDTTYITNATSLDNADVLLDAAISELSANTIAAINETNNNLSELSAATINLSAGTVAVDAKVDELSANTMAVDEALDNKIDELSANTMAADHELADRITELEGNKILGISAITVDVLENGDSKVSLVINEEDDKILSQNAIGLKAKVTLDYVSADKKIYLKGKNDVVISEVDATDFIKDGMLDSANVIVATEEDHAQYPELIVGKTYIKLLFNTDAEQPGKANPVFISADDLVDIYTVAPESYSYMSINDYVISLNVDQEGGLASYDYARNISAVTTTIIKAAGLNMGEPGSYPGHDETHYIKDATSLDNADVLLDAAIWETSGLVADISNRVDALSGVVESFSSNTVEALSALSVSVDERIESGLTIISGVVENYVEEKLSGITGDLIDRIENELCGLTEDLSELSGIVIDNELVTAAALNDLNDRIRDLSGNTIGNIEELSGSVVDNQSAITVLSALIEDNELVTAAALNDLNRRIIDNDEDIADILIELENVSAKTSGVLTLSLNGVEQGQYCPSANTSINLEAIQEVTGEDVLLTNYVISSETDKDALEIRPTDNVNQAFGKIEKKVNDNELVTAAALNDLNDKINELSGSSNDNITILSGIIVDNELVTAAALNDLNSRIIDLSGNTGDMYADLDARIRNLSGGGASQSDVLVLSSITINNIEKINAISGDVSNCFDGAEYNSTDKKIYFKHGNTVKGEIDATAFIKDGMVDNVSINSGNLVITFNTDAGKENIVLALTDIFDPGNYYNKTEINALSSATETVKNNLTVLSGAVESLSASVVTNKTNIQNLSAATVGLENNVDALSASVVTNKMDIATLSGDVIDNELVIAAALNDLNARIIDLSGDTPDMSNYYSTANTYNKTEIEQYVSAATQLKYTTSNALANLTLSEFLTIATITANTTLSFASTGLPTLPANGVAQRHIIIENTGSSDVVVTITNDSRVKITPNNANFNQFAIDAGGRGELNVLITYNGSAYTIYVITT